MDAVRILRQLWRFRVLVAVGLALALTVGISLTYRVGLGVPPTFESRQYPVGIASAEVLVDSPNSQVIDLGNSETKADVTSLNARARLLADLVATSPLKDRIARRAGIAPDQLIAIRPSVGPVSDPTPLETGATVSTGDPRAQILSVRVHESLPIIGADTQAPDPATAARISDAAVAELDLYLKNAASAGAVPEARKLLVEPLGPARSSLVTRGPRRTTAVITAVLLFLVWCGGILISSTLARNWRQASEQALSGPEPDATDPTPVPSLALATEPTAATTASEEGEPEERSSRARKSAGRSDRQAERPARATERPARQVRTADRPERPARAANPKRA